MKVCFVVGSADISGGTFVIFEHALHMRRCGHDVCLVTIFPFNKLATTWHPATQQLEFCSFEGVQGRHFDIAIATWWRTVYELYRIDASHYCYFVQSIETWFYPPEEAATRNLVEATYMVGLPVITEARWIAGYLKKRFAAEAQLAPNGLRKDIYREDGPVVASSQPAGLRVLIEGHIGVSFKNVPRTIELVRRANVGEIWLLTPTPIRSYPGVDRVFSCVPIDKTAEIYRSCDILVKLSLVEGMFGPPLEMFACGGTAIVYDVSGHEEYIRDGVNARVVATNDEAEVIAILNRLAHDRTTLDALRAAAVSTATAWPDWHQASARFLECVTNLPESSTRRSDIVRSAQLHFLHYARVEQILARCGLTRRMLARFRGGLARLAALDRIQPLKRAISVWQAAYWRGRFPPMPVSRD